MNEEIPKNIEALQPSGDPIPPGHDTAPGPAIPVVHNMPGHSRRTFLFKLSLLINGAVGAVLAVPIIGYLVGPSLKKSSSDNSWVDLGSLTDFPEGETRLVNYRNPITTEWD